MFLGFWRGSNPTWARFGEYTISPLTLAIFVAGGLVIGQFSFWGNYLPRVFPLHLRGTGESMAANVGGRMLGTGCASLTAMLGVKGSWLPESIAPGPPRIAFAAACVVGSLALLACLLISFLPEPTAESESAE
jgi:hypothetical protein